MTSALPLAPGQTGAWLGIFAVTLPPKKIVFRPAFCLGSGFLNMMENQRSDIGERAQLGMHLRYFASLVVLLCMLALAPALAYELKGLVVSVADGDTITVRVGEQNYRIRLASIDAPEKGAGSDRPGQPYSEASRRFLSDQVAGQTVSLDCFEEDRYGRHICDILMGEVTVNQLLVKAGMAWANRQGNDKYLRDQGLLALQNDAEANRRGLWAEPNPVAPWVWRRECWGEGRCGR